MLSQPLSTNLNIYVNKKSSRKVMQQGSKNSAKVILKELRKKAFTTKGKPCVTIETLMFMHNRSVLQFEFSYC